MQNNYSRDLRAAEDTQFCPITLVVSWARLEALRQLQKLTEKALAAAQVATTVGADAEAIAASDAATAALSDFCKENPFISPRKHQRSEPSAVGENPLPRETIPFRYRGQGA